MCADIHDGREQTLPSMGRIQMRETNYSRSTFRLATHGRSIQMCHKATYAVQQRKLYSITSSARASSEGGISIPSVFAVCRLMTNSNLVGSWTGISAGFSPLRIRPA